MQFLDLPNDMLLKVAERLKCEGRRRLSKANQSLFHLIRNQKNWTKYSVREEITSIDLYTFSNAVYLFRMDFGIGRQPVRLFYCLHGAKMKRYLSQIPIAICSSPSQVAYVTDPKKHALEVLEEAFQYYSPRSQTYQFPLELFDSKIAESFGQVARRANFVILSDTLNEHMEFVYCQLFLQYLQTFVGRKTSIKQQCNPSFYITHKYLTNPCENEALQMNELEEKTGKWRREMIQRLQIVCEAFHIRSYFTRDSRKLKYLNRNFCLQMHSDGVLGGRLKPLRFVDFPKTAKWDEGTESFEGDYDTDSDPEL